MPTRLNFLEGVICRPTSASSISPSPPARILLIQPWDHLNRLPEPPDYFIVNTFQSFVSVSLPFQRAVQW